MKLGRRQEEFARLVPRLIDKAYELGYRGRGGSWLRDARLHGHKHVMDVMSWLEQEFPEVAHEANKAGYRAYGSRSSEHKDKCAIDLNLRKPGFGMVVTTEEHRKLGEYWESLHPMCRWGGRYNDGNHYEFLEWR